jgi:phosphoglycolate phosphatase-like HAD superfamily hydrolase
VKNDHKREHWTYRVSGIEPGDAVILDIDGVLADASGRQHHLTRNDWRSFFEDVNEDPVIAEVGVMAQLLDSSLQIILVTGRPHRVSAKTVSWLNEHNLRWDILVMREHGNNIGVDTFKLDVLEQLREDGYKVRLAVDDDPKNHAMYVKAGVPCIYIHSGYYL